MVGVRDEGAAERGGSSASIVGRDDELAALHAFLGEGLRGSLVLTGGPGIGKTTLWEAGIDAARRRGLRALSARATGAEAQLAFAALIDLLDGIDLGALAALPPPQRRALDVALLRADATGSPPGPRAVAFAFLSTLRALAGDASLVVAVDDVQWLDAPSTDALAFAAGRLDGVVFLLAKRPGTSSALERELERRAFTALEVGPLSLGATRRLLLERLGLSLSRPQLRRVHDATLGNPLFALEVGRTLVEGGSPDSLDDIPVSDTIEQLLGTRVARLPPGARQLLLAVALSADVQAAQLVELADAAALDEAVDAGVVVVDGDRVRPVHPLLAAAARRHSRAAERRELHLALAGVVADRELRALHLALATELPDAGLAANVAAAAAAASARGARHEAAELAGHALRLTPPTSPERSDRLLALAGYLDHSGELQRVTDLLTPVVDSLPAGDARVRAWLLLAEGGGVRTLSELEHHLDRALAECGGDPVLRAHVLATKSDHAAASAVTQIRQAEAWAQEALGAAPRAGPEVEQRALLALGWARGLRGFAIDDLCKRFRTVSDAASSLAGTPERVAAQRLVWRGDLLDARARITGLLRLADERGEPLAYALNRLHLCELELRAGAWDDAERLLDEWAESAEGELLIWPMYSRCRALLAAGRGLPDDAERWAADALGQAEASGGGWDRLEAQRASGIALLLAHEPARAAERLRAVWEHTRREGVDEPGVFPVAPDLVEALVALRELDEARAVTSRLRELADQQEHPWGRATAKRCNAIVELSGGEYDEDAAAELSEAAASYARLGLRFDAARALLGLGRAQRRLRKWGTARASLEQAASAFDEIGSAGWAEATQSELARVGGRRTRSPGELTEAERRVVGLAVEGLSNKEIARALVVTVPTVERHLSHAYAKLGVRSRAQLAARFAGT